MKHVMIDLETMGLRPNAAIVAIGAVHFRQVIDLSGPVPCLSLEEVGEFRAAVSLKSCLDAGLTVDQSTVDWWNKQPAETRSFWQREDALSLESALTTFSRWLLTDSTESQISPWGNGADFDLVLLKSAYSALGADPPWRYYNNKCYRTIRSLFPVTEMPRLGTHHDALDDARHQFTVLRQIVRTHEITIK